MVQETHFTALVELCAKLQQTARRTEMVQLVGAFLHSLGEEEIGPAVLLIIGMVFPASDPRTLNLSWRTIQRVEDDLSLERDRRPLTIVEVYRYFCQIASASGKGSRAKKESLLKEMLSRARELEVKYLLKMIFGEMQHGVGEGVMLEAIARSAGVDVELVRKAYMFAGDLGQVATVALRKGKIGLQAIDIQIFKPIQPMLAQVAKDLDQVFSEHRGRTALEYKFDGARVQIHKNAEQVKIFSRHLSDVTDSFPDIVQLAKKRLKVGEAVAEGEVIAVGEGQKPLPFQQIMRRFRRVHRLDETIREVPVRLYLFDLLYWEGKSLIDTPYEERRTLLSSICDPSLLAPRLVTHNVAAAKEFLSKAMDCGHEGLMAKALDSHYNPGARGKNWFKIKPADHLDLTVVAADWGHGRRRGWLSNYHLAARDEESGRLYVVGKTFKGLTDKEFAWITQRLQALKTSESLYTVYVRPEIVVEVAYNEIQKSPHYQSGFALRFARISRIREDKNVDQIDTIERIRELYERQFKRKAKK